MSKLYFVLFALSLIPTISFSAPKIPDVSTYLGGRQLCEDVYAKMLVHEQGFYTTVPVDYSNPAAGTTDIYAFFANANYDPTKPTIIYFNGGPGQPSHWGMSIEGAQFNVLLMDQRGIACSRPQTWQQLMNPQFYSSESVARDAETLRQTLNLGKISVYGVSYGTIPATIYGHLFPEATRSVILEGVVNQADNELWSSSYRRQLLQNMIDALPRQTRQILEEISARYNIDPRWLFVLAADLMGSSEGFARLQEKLSSVTDPAALETLAKKLSEYFAEITYEPHILFLGNDIPYYMIACQEMGMAIAGLSTQDVYVRGKLSPMANTVDIGFCAQINAKSGTVYSAKNYPIKVPTYYFQGAEDFQTPLPQALAHAASVPQGKKTFLLMDHGGHNPNMSSLRGESAAQLGMFTRAILAQDISQDLLLKFNEENPGTPWNKR